MKWIVVSSKHMHTLMDHIGLIARFFHYCLVQQRSLIRSSLILLLICHYFLWPETIIF